MFDILFYWHCSYCSILFCLSLREKCPYTEFFLVSIFPHSEWIRRHTEYLSVFSPSVGKYGPGKTPYMDTSRSVCPSMSVMYYRFVHLQIHSLICFLLPRNYFFILIYCDQAILRQYPLFCKVHPENQNKVSILATM